MRAPSKNIARHLPDMAARQPDRPAVKVPRGRTRSGDIDYLTLSFAELDAEVDAWVARFAARGVVQGDRVLVMVRQGLPLISAAFALFKHGAVPVVIDPGMGLKSFLACVARTRPRVLLGIPFAQLISRICWQPFTSIQTRLWAPSSPTARLTKSGPIINHRSSIINPSSAADLAAILFTSGSTGAPKGVRYEHGMFDAQVRLVRETYGIEPGEIDLPMLPVFALFNPALGMTTVVPEIDPARPAQVDPAKIVRAIQQEKVTNTFGSPAIWRRLTRHCAAGNITLPSLRRVLMAGAPVPPALFAAVQQLLPHGTPHSPYGATEALPVSSISADEVVGPRNAKPQTPDAKTPATPTPPLPPDSATSATPSASPLASDPLALGVSSPPPVTRHLSLATSAATAAGHGTCVGRPVAGVEVRIIAITDQPIATLADARELPPGEIGEIIVSGPNVTRAYDQLAAATAAAKIQSPAAKRQIPGDESPTSRSEPSTLKPASSSTLTSGPLASGVSVPPSGAFWHRMGDTGYLDAHGRLWFCGRKAERVETADGPLYTEQVEPIFAAHASVRRVALVGLGAPGRQRPAVVVEPVSRDVVATPSLRRQLVRELRALGAAHPHTERIRLAYLHPSFPVDVRHNTKIHRLTLARWAESHPGYEMDRRDPPVH